MIARVQNITSTFSPIPIGASVLSQISNLERSDKSNICSFLSRTLVGVAPTGKVADLHKYKDANGGNDPWMDTVWGGYDDSTIQKWFSKPDLYPGEAKHSHWYGMKFGEYFGFTTLGTGGSIGAAVGLEVGDKKGRASDPNNRTVDGGSRLSRQVRTTVGNQVTSSAFHDIDAYEISQLTFASDSYPPFVTVYMWRRLG